VGGRDLQGAETSTADGRTCSAATVRAKLQFVISSTSTDGKRTPVATPATRNGDEEVATSSHRVPRRAPDWSVFRQIGEAR